MKTLLMIAGVAVVLLGLLWVGQGLGYSILVTRPHGDHSYAGDALEVRTIADEVERGVIALAALKQMRKTRLVSAFETHCVEYFQNVGTNV